MIVTTTGLYMSIVCLESSTASCTVFTVRRLKMPNPTNSDHPDVLDELHKQVISTLGYLKYNAPEEYIRTCKAVKKLIRERDERVAREARLTACSNTLEDVSKILTGSDDFKISPGVELGLGIGQIRTLRAALSTLERTYKAQLKPTSEESE